LIENWRSVVGFEGSYEVSDLGRVRSLDRIIIRKDGMHVSLKGKILKHSHNPKGYCQLILNPGNNNRKIHTLVLEAFVGPAPPGLECRHADGDKTNNRLNNLSWGTGSENTLDRVRHGNDHHHRRTNCPLDHSLKLPNLVAIQWEKGYRTCLACSRARSKVNYAKRSGLILPEDRKTIADRYYREIMEVTVDH